MKNLGDAINLARRSAGLSQKKLAEILGISYGYVSEIELNKKMPSDELIATDQKVWGSNPYGCTSKNLG